MISELTLDYVLERVQFEPNSGCWLFDDPDRPRWRGGYPTVLVGVTGDFKTVRISRWLLARKLGRDLLPEVFACHWCDTPECLNPDHLFDGTAADNTADAKRKRRWNRKPHWTANPRLVALYRGRRGRPRKQAA